MRNLFTSLVLGAAVTATAFSAIPAQAAIENIDIYGQMAVSAYTLSKDGADDATTGLENESRVGFRGEHDMERGPIIIWQIEAGNVGSGTGNDFSKLGNRDTFGGFKGGFGTIRFGRVLTPFYEIVDWPYSNPGLGNVFDWGYGIDGGAYYDRHSNQVRWDSPTWSGFRMALSGGKGANTGLDDSLMFSAAAHYANGPFALHLGVETDMSREVSGVSNTKDADGNDVNVDTTSDTTAMIAGGEFHHSGFGLMAAYKTQKAEYDNSNTSLGEDQMVNSFSIIGQYSGIDNVIIKAGYAYNSEKEVSGKSIDDTDDNVISGQLMYSPDPAVWTYLRVKQMKLDADDYTEVRLGVEYYF